MNNKFSIVVQGPFDNKIWNDYHYTDHYLKYVSKVIVSCYNDDDTKDFEEYTKSNNRVILIKNPCPTFHCNPCNMYVHAFSTLRGLEKSETEFTIKIRANEYFTQIDKIIHMIEKFPDKYFACNVHTMKVRHYSYKVSDHLFGGRTEWLKGAMQQTLDWCHLSNCNADKHSALQGIPEIDNHGQTEHVFFLAFLKTKGVQFNKLSDIYKSLNHVAQIMKENLAVLAVSELYPYIISNHGQGHCTYNNYWYDPECASTTDELGEGLC